LNIDIFKNKNCFFFSETSSTFTNYESGFAWENIRLEKDVLSKLGVRYTINSFIYLKDYIRVQVNYMFFQWEIVFGHQLKIQGRKFLVFFSSYDKTKPL